jgi:hypothetical protein
MRMLRLLTRKPRLCFIHVPKCAGGSLHHALSGHYGIVERQKLSAQRSRRVALSRGVGLHDYREELLLAALGTRRLRYVSGHYRISREILEKYQSDWHFLTVLRDPVERWISEYFFNRYKRLDHCRTERGLVSYVRSARGYNSARTYLRLFGGWHREADRELCIDRAMRTLEQFRIVGTTERSDLLAGRIHEVLGFTIEPDRRNENPISQDERQKLVTPALRKRIASMCADDLLVYRHAQRLSGALAAGSAAKR